MFISNDYPTMNRLANRNTVLFIAANQVLDLWTWTFRSGVILYPDHFSFSMGKVPYVRKRRASSKRRTLAKRRNTTASYVLKRALTSYVRRRRGARQGLRGRGRTKLVMFNKLLQRTLRTKLVYCDTKTIAPGTGSAYHVYRLNNCFDPDFTGVGHQPAFWDRWTALYENYKVIATKWTVTWSAKRPPSFVNAASGGTSAGETHAVVDSSHADQAHNPGILAWQVSEGSGASGREQISAVDKNILRETRSNKTVGYKMTSAHPFRTYRMSGYHTTRSILGPEVANQYDSTNGGPSTNWYLHLAAMSKDGHTMSDYRFDIKLEFIVEFHDIKTPEDEN